MLDVHAPHEKIHGLRDFLLHLLTITVGLLIALGLEAGVEGLHHRHQRHEAEETIRQELEQNRESLKKIQMNLVREQADLHDELLILEDLRNGQHDDLTKIKLTLNSEPLQSAAWHTASSTGAISYMPYATVQSYSEAYQLQDDFERLTYTTFLQFEEVVSYVTAPDHSSAMYPKASDVDSAIRAIHLTLADLRGLQDLGRGTLETYGDALK